MVVVVVGRVANWQSRDQGQGQDQDLPRLRNERHPKIEGKIAELDQELDREVKDQQASEKIINQDNQIVGETHGKPEGTVNVDREG